MMNDLSDLRHSTDWNCGTHCIVCGMSIVQAINEQRVCPGPVDDGGAANEPDPGGSADDYGDRLMAAVRACAG